MPETCVHFGQYRVEFGGVIYGLCAGYSRAFISPRGFAIRCVTTPPRGLTCAVTIGPHWLMQDPGWCRMNFLKCPRGLIWRFSDSRSSLSQKACLPTASPPPKRAHELRGRAEAYFRCSARREYRKPALRSSAVPTTGPLPYHRVECQVSEMRRSLRLSKRGPIAAWLLPIPLTSVNHQRFVGVRGLQTSTS